MRGIRKVSDKLEACFAANKIKKYSYHIVERETRELSAENGQISLLRTLFDNSATVSAFKEGKHGLVRGNDFSDQALEALVKSAILAAESGVKDNANDIAKIPDTAKFRQGCTKPDFDKFFDRVTELISDIEAEYPKVQIVNVIAEYVKVHALFKNSKGVDFEETSGQYSVSVEFAGHDGDKTTSLDYAGVQFKDLDSKIIDLGNFRYHLDGAQKQLEQIPLTGKFTGTVIFTPELFAEFLYMVVRNYLSDSVMIDGTSLWKRKLGRRVASPKLSFALKSFDKRIVIGERYTSDGFKTEDLPVIEKGILKNFCISLYAAKKLNREVTKNSSSDIVVQPGTTPLEQMISTVKNGLIVGGFSGGRPSTSGDFSGVAKNSYYIQDGKIQGAVSEVMINGNLGDALMNIKDISSDFVADGGMVVPYVMVDGITVSGK